MVALIITAGVATCWWWYQDTSDLDAIRADATAKGIPTTWVETRLVLSPANHLADYQRLGNISERLKDYDSEVILRGTSADPSLRLKPHLPIPPAARDHHAALDGMLLEELLAIIDRMPRQPLTLRDERTTSTTLPEIGWQRALTRLLSERVLLASPEDVITEHDRLLRLTELRECRSLIDLLVHLSMVELTLNATAGRLSELKPFALELAGRLELIDQQLEGALLSTFTGEFIISLHSVSHLDEVRASTGTPKSTWNDLALGPTVRCGREALLREELFWIQEIQKRPTPSDLVVLAKVVKDRRDQLSTWMPRDLLLRMLANVVPVVLTGTATCRTRLHLMIAELRQQPWPIDPFDPSGKSLRRVERDDALMGAYTLYEDGADNGGHKRKDRYFPLYGPLEPPTQKTP